MKMKMKLKISKLNKKLQIIQKGGGDAKIKKHHDKGKLTARERIDCLLDKGCDYLEIGSFAGYDMYKEHGGCPAGGVLVVIGYVSKKLCVVVANDATVKAGAWFPITGKKEFKGNKK